MKIVLTHAYFLNEDQREQSIMKPYVPIGILYISSWLDMHGFDHRVYDTTFSDFDKQCEYIYEQKPEVVGIYTNLMTKLNVLRLIRWIRNHNELKNTKIILGGPEVRNHIDAFLNYGADYLVLGEGEESILELLNFLNSNSVGYPEQVDGIAFIRNGKIQCNKDRILLKNLDDLPMPNRKKIDLQQYFDVWKMRHGTSSVSVSTMRGCPYTCRWCSRAVYGQSYRRRSAKNVVDELEWIQQNYSVDSFWFVDDVFTISHKWLNDFNDELKLRNISVSYECITRADRMNEEVISILKQSGCFRVWIGAESGSQRVIDLMDRRVELNQVTEMIKLSKQKGIETGTFIMIGYPGETEKDIYATLYYLKKSDPDLFTSTIAYPIKGTPLYDQVASLFVKDLAWDSSTDRDIDFKRTYPRRYYDFAIRMLVNEVSAFKSRDHLNRKYLYKFKAILAKGGMIVFKLFSF